MTTLEHGAARWELIDLIECWTAEILEELPLFEALAERATTNLARRKLAGLIATRSRRLTWLKQRRAALRKDHNDADTSSEL